MRVMMLILSACLAACGLSANPEADVNPDAGWSAATQTLLEPGPLQPTALEPTALEPSPLQPTATAPSYETGPADELSLPALRSRIDLRLEAGEQQAALDDMDVFVFRFAAAPSSERYRAQLTGNDREVRERPPLQRRRLAGQLLRAIDGVGPMQPVPQPPPRARARPRVRMMPPRVQGSLSRDIVHRVMRRHLGEVRQCYERILNRRPDVAGRVALRIVIAATGQVMNATVTEDTTGGRALGQCVSSRVRRWRFPASNGSGILVVHTRLLFTTD